MTRSIFTLVAAAALAGCATRGRGDEMATDVTVYTAKRIRTMDPARPLAEAISIRGRRILEVGARAEVIAAAGEGARIVELGDGTIVPGLEDAHAHLLNLGRALATVNLTETSTSKEALERIAAAPQSSWLGDWLVGRGWDQNDWSDLGGGYPDRKPLDAITQDKPIVLTRIDGHAAWVNSEALRRAGISRQTPDPAGGRILRDGSGEPTGVLIDNAMDLVTVKIPEPSEPERTRWLRAALTRCAEVGLTTIHDAGMDLATFMLLQSWDAFGQLPLRLYVMANGQEKDADAFLDRGPFQGRNLTQKAVKFWADGALGSRGAAFHAPYSDEPSQSGLLLMAPDELERKARAFMERGFQVNIHAIGDRANTIAIEVLGKVAKETGTVGLRHRVEHAQILRVEDIPKMKAAGLVASMQPTHATSDMPWAEARVGKERLAGAYAWRKILDAGIPLAFGSDFPIELPDPLHGIYSARTRQDPKGQPPGGWLPEERLSGEEALRAFTAGAAFAAQADDRRGMLKPGFDADFVAVGVDPVEAPAIDVYNGKVLMTVVAGETVFSRSR